MKFETKNLFKKDSFSDSKMHWTELKKNSKLYSQVSKVLQEFYPKIDQKLLTLKVSGIGKLNSSNVLIKTKTHEYVMKIFPSERINSANYLEMININLKDNFQNAPLLVENLKGKGFTEYKSDLFLLYEKVGNRHFHGKEGEFKNFFEIFKRFVNNYPIDSANYVEQPLISKDAEDILNEFILLEWGSNPLKKYQKKIKNSSHFLFEKIKIVQEKIKLYDLNNLRPMHIDLHPHNIAVSEKEMYLLDLEAIQLSSISRSLGFAIYKLVRQSVANGTDIKNFYNFFNGNTFLDFLDQVNLTKDELKVAATQEVLRRIFILIDLLKQGDSNWAFVLPMHLNGLSEIEIIFKR